MNKYRCSLFKGAKYDNDDDGDDTEAIAMLPCQHAIGQHVKNRLFALSIQRHGNNRYARITPKLNETREIDANSFGENF